MFIRSVRHLLNDCSRLGDEAMGVCGVVASRRSAKYMPMGVLDWARPGVKALNEKLLPIKSVAWNNNCTH